MSKQVSIDGFQSAVTEIIGEYAQAVTEEVNEAVEDVAKESQKQLKVEGGFSNRTGKYRKGWKINFERKRYGLMATIYNTRYQLTHLLESGHAKWLWGRSTGETVQAFPHISTVNDEAQQRLEEEIKRRISE